MKISELGNNWQVIYEKAISQYQMKMATQIAYYYRPKKLYKYFSFNEHWKENITNGTIICNDPLNFNDPQDSRWFLDYEEILRARFADIGQQWETLGLDINNMIQLYEEDLCYLRSLFRISCFSETPYSNLMWGHYADKHQGFCIEYDTSYFPKTLQLLLPIIYGDQPFDASNILDMRGIDDKLAVIIPALHKSADWKYEKEWRVFINGGEQEIKFLHIPETITGIYFGLNSWNHIKEREEIEKFANEKKIILHQMERTYRSYNLVSNTLEELRTKTKLNGLLF